ncbi:hypothetical protein QWA68_015139 [Fusarium oxysporum]|nr:hypothetical protein QWA68_015139 [Fusarium oxysporum]
MLFHIRMRRDPAAKQIPADLKWEQLLYMLYGASALIMARSIFRMVEFIMGHDGYLLSTEWPLFVFDSTPMLVVMAIFWYWFPSVVQQPHTDSTWERTTSESNVVILDDMPRK